MFCAMCGSASATNTSYCVACGARLDPTTASGGANGRASELASFWPRFGAFVLDGIISGIPAILAGVAIAFLFGAAVASGQNEPLSRSQEIDQNAEISDAALVGFYLAYIAVYFLYHWISTAVGGGFGKRMLGIRVVDEHTLEAPGFGKAFGRVLVSVVSRLALYLGYLWPIWDSKKRTWHDMACGTIVVRADSLRGTNRVHAAFRRAA